LPSDTQYNEQSYSAMFDRADRLVTTSYDGSVRLYAADQYAAPIAQFRSEGDKPYAAAFSPDGTRVAVGFEDTRKVVVLSGSDLTRLFEADTTGIPDVGLFAVGWSQDGRFLFAGGQWLVNNEWQIRRWSDDGHGAFVDIPAGSNTVMAILGLQSGSMLFAHANGFGLISPDATMTPVQGFGGLGGGSALRVSADGGAVQVDAWKPRHSYRFALGERRVDVDPPADSTLLAPITQAPGLDVTNWHNSATPAVNGAPIKLESEEWATSLAVVPGTQHFVLAAAWTVRLFDQLGHELWPKGAAGPGTPWYVNVTGDGRLVIVAYGDGTIRWLRLSDGKELLALFIHRDGKRWIAWTPQGYYDASVGGDELIGWHVNHGYDHVPDFYPVSRFRDQFNRPDIVDLVLKTLDVNEAMRRANAASGRKAPAAVADRLPPVVKIVSPSDRSSVTTSPIAVTYQVRSPAPVTGIKIIVDGRPVATAPPPEDDRLASLTIDMPPHNAVISLVAANEKASSEAAVVHIGWQGAKDWYKPDLYVLAVGVSQYHDKNLDLTYPDKDAEDFVKVMRAQAGGLYKNVYARDLPDEPIKDWSLTSLKEKLIKIGAKVINHGRYVTFQMAEVAIPRNLFADILRLIAELRPPPATSTA
jgi:WD40 repeat protein